MTTEFDLRCVSCEGRLERRTVSADALGIRGESLTIAECSDCGERYFPESALERF